MHVPNAGVVHNVDIYGTFCKASKKASLEDTKESGHGLEGSRYGVDDNLQIKLYVYGWN